MNIVTGLPEFAPLPLLNGQGFYIGFFISRGKS